MSGLSSAPSLSHSSSVVSAVKNIVSSCLSALSTILIVSFESVSAFASRCWSGISGAGLNIDQLIIHIKQLEIYSYELLDNGTKLMKQLGKEGFFSHLYEIEDFLTTVMIQFTYVRQTMEWVILGIIQTVKRVMRGVSLSV